tara:strand:- start:650 stop:844 length:195 start_codon:yes stop_codon:yes gene_type:complete
LEHLSLYNSAPDVIESVFFERGLTEKALKGKKTKKQKKQIVIFSLKILLPILFLINNFFIKKQE